MTSPLTLLRPLYRAILLELSKSNATPIELVSRSEDITRGSVYHYVYRLHQAGLIHGWYEDREAGQRGPRRVRYALTGDGEAVIHLDKVVQANNAEEG